MPHRSPSAAASSRRRGPRPRARLAAALAALLSSYAATGAQRPVDRPARDFVVIDGDILIPDDWPLPEGGSCSLSVTYPLASWPDGIVPFVFDPAVDAADRAAMYAAMDEWIYCGADVTFVPIDDPDPLTQSYVTIFDSTANNSSIGMYGPGLNQINIFNWSYEFIMAHELGHTLGFWHEQSRTDRDTYVTIQCANVSQTACSGGPCDSNFQIRTPWLVFGTGYDFDSVMHYGECVFSIDPSCPAQGQTILANAPYAAWQSLMGQRDHLSASDVADMVDLYGASVGARFVEDRGQLVSIGTLTSPFTTVLASGLSPAGAPIWIAGGTYAEGPLTLDDPRLIRAYPGATVVIR